MHTAEHAGQIRRVQEPMRNIIRNLVEATARIRPRDLATCEYGSIRVLAE